MARVTRYVDDMTGKEIEEGQGGPVRFSLQDDYYEMDLSNDSLAKLEKLLQPYMDKAMVSEAPRVVEAPARGRGRRAAVAPSPGRGGSGLSKDQLDAIRAWARANGYEVADRGRIKGEIIEAFEAAHTK